jgi:hypothetical protein
MFTNAGSKLIRKEADVVGAGTVWFDPDALANILSFGLLSDKFRITYDNEVEDAFCVYLPSGMIKFTRQDDGLYRFRLPDEYLGRQCKSSEKHYGHAIVPKGLPCHQVTTRAENRKNYTERQYERAKRARDFYHSVGTPMLGKFKALLRSNMVSDCPITYEDVCIAEKIFGPSVAKLKGKSTRKTPAAVVPDVVDVSLECIMLLAVIDAKEKRDSECYDVPNAFIQAKLPEGHE